MSMSLMSGYPPSSMSISLSSSPVQLAHAVSSSSSITTTTTTTTTNNNNNCNHDNHNNCNHNNYNRNCNDNSNFGISNSESRPTNTTPRDQIHERGIFQLPPPPFPAIDRRLQSQNRNVANPSHNHHSRHQHQNILHQSPRAADASVRTSQPPQTPLHPVPTHLLPTPQLATAISTATSLHRHNHRYNLTSHNHIQNYNITAATVFGQPWSFPAISPSPTILSPLVTSADYNWSPVTGSGAEWPIHYPQDHQNQNPVVTSQTPTPHLLLSNQGSAERTLPGFHHIGLPISGGNTEPHFLGNCLNLPALPSIFTSGFSPVPTFIQSSESTIPLDSNSYAPLPPISNLFPLVSAPLPPRQNVIDILASSSPAEIMPTTRKRSAEAAAATAAAAAGSAEDSPAVNTRSRTSAPSKRRRISESKTLSSRRHSSQAKSHAVSEAAKAKAEEVGREEENDEVTVVDVVDLVDRDQLLEDLPEQPDSRIKLATFQCVICMDDATGLVVTHCGHLFCTECLQSALSTDATKNKCPICRQMVEVRTRTTHHNRTKCYWELELKLMTVTRKGKRPAQRS